MRGGGEIERGRMDMVVAKTVDEAGKTMGEVGWVVWSLRKMK